jgi:hypothetical protein
LTAFAPSCAKPRQRWRTCGGACTRRATTPEWPAPAARAAEEAEATARAAAATAASAHDAELRRVRARLADAETAVEGARRAAREGRSMDDARLRLLLDTVVEAAQGLRRELALPPTTVRPADAVAAVAAEAAGVSDVATRALSGDDPAVLDDLLALPQVHLVVDGYNVTKTGYGTLPLEAQRTRLVGRWRRSPRARARR